MKDNAENTLDISSSYELAGVPSEKGVPPQEVPVPAVVLLVGTGLLGMWITLGVGRRRRMNWNRAI